MKSSLAGVIIAIKKALCTVDLADGEEVSNDNGPNFKAFHVMIHQVKSWISTTYSLVSEKNFNQYFGELCYRVNRSQSQETIFKNLINRMVKADNFSR